MKPIGAIAFIMLLGTPIVALAQATPPLTTPPGQQMQQQTGPGASKSAPGQKASAKKKAKKAKTKQ